MVQNRMHSGNAAVLLGFQPIWEVSLDMVHHVCGCSRHDLYFHVLISHAMEHLAWDSRGESPVPSSWIGGLCNTCCSSVSSVENVTAVWCACV